MQPVHEHKRGDRRDLDHPMAQRIWINTSQQLIATVAGIRVVIHHLIHPLNRQQFRPTGEMALLAAPLAATALAPHWRLIPPSPSLEGCHSYAEALRLGGVAGAPADPLPQVCQLGGQGGELAAQ